MYDVTGRLQVQERFLGFWDVATTDGKTLCLKIQDIHHQLGINLSSLEHKHMMVLQICVDDTQGLPHVLKNLNRVHYVFIAIATFSIFHYEIAVLVIV